MELELPDLVEWNEKWKKEIDDLVGKSGKRSMRRRLVSYMNL